MFELFSEMWSFVFMQRAFVATTVLSASVAPVGAFLVLRRLSLAGEAMAHAITPGVVVTPCWRADRRNIGRSFDGFIGP